MSTQAAPATPPAATPPQATPPATPPPNQKPVDPFIENLAKSFGNILEPDGKLKPIEVKETTPPNPVSGGIPLSERVAGRAEANATTPPAADPPTAPAAPTTTPAATPAPDKVKVKRPAAAQLKEELDAMRNAAPEPNPLPLPPAPRTETPPVQTSADDYVKTLSEEQRQEYEFAQYAAKTKSAYKDFPDRLLAYFKKIDEYAIQNPEADPDSEEFRTFVTKNQPSYSGSDRKSIEIQKIKDEVTESAKAEVKKEMQDSIDAVQRKQYEMEMAPKVEQALGSFRDMMSSEEVPEGIVAIDAEVGKKIATEGYEAAATAFPIEAPIYARAEDAAREFLMVRNGLKKVDQANPTHAWLGNFIHNQGVRTAEVTAGKRDNTGRTFMPWFDYHGLVQKDPEGAKKHYTFSDADVLDMISVNAHIEATVETKKLEAAGYSRQKKSAAASNPPATPTPAPATPPPVPARDIGSPRAGASMSPGAGSSAQKQGANASFFEQLMPGGGKYAT